MIESNKKPLVHVRDERNSRGTTLVSHTLTTFFSIEKHDNVFAHLVLCTLPHAHKSLWRCIHAFVVTGRFRFSLLILSANCSGVILGSLPVSGYTNPELSTTETVSVLSPSLRTLSVEQFVCSYCTGLSTVCQSSFRCKKVMSGHKKCSHSARRYRNCIHILC